MFTINYEKEENHHCEPRKRRGNLPRYRSPRPLQGLGMTGTRWSSLRWPLGAKQSKNLYSYLKKANLESGGGKLALLKNKKKIKANSLMPDIKYPHQCRPRGARQSMLCGKWIASHTLANSDVSGYQPALVRRYM